MKESTVLAIPIYNCENQIINVLDDVFTFPDLCKEVWIIDNKSSDDSIQHIRHYLSAMNTSIKTSIFQNNINIGFGGSHKVIFEKFLDTTYSNLIVIHGDFQARTSDVIQMFNAPFEKDTFHLGSRFMKGSQRKNYSFLRVVWNLVFNCLMSLKTNTRVYDLGSGLNMYPKDKLKEINFETLPNDLTFNVELLKRISNAKFEIQWHPISWHSDAEKSNVKALSQTLKTLILIFRGSTTEEKIVNKTVLIDQYP